MPLYQKGADQPLENLNLELEYFDGPLPLLLSLVEKNDIDLYNIEISIITDQFLAYMDRMREFQMELSSDFVVMAASLLEIKSRMLLPNGENAYKDIALLGEEDPRYELVQRLIEYKRYKQVSEKLKELAEDYSGRREKSKKSLPETTKEGSELYLIDASILSELMREILMRAPLEDETRQGFFESIKREKLSVELKRKEILEKLIHSGRSEFRSCVGQLRSKEELIVSFLALLDLIRDELVLAYQDVLMGEIYIEALVK